jgi:segregation and condensation protein B
LVLAILSKNRHPQALGIHILGAFFMNTRLKTSLKPQSIIWYTCVYMNLEAQIEAVLFYKAEPMRKKALADFFECTEEDIENALVALGETLKSRGIRLTLTDTHAQLVTAGEASELIETLRKADLKTDIGKAGAETLAIILYRGPLSRVEIDRVRGVNSAFIIRNLLIRGLIERRAHPSDTRSFTYSVTPSLLNHLGVSRKEELPDFGVIMDALDVFEKSQNTGEEENPFSKNNS